MYLSKKDYGVLYTAIINAIPIVDRSKVKKVFGHSIVEQLFQFVSLHTGKEGANSLDTVFPQLSFSRHFYLLEMYARIGADLASGCPFATAHTHDVPASRCCVPGSRASIAHRL